VLAQLLEVSQQVLLSYRQHCCYLLCCAPARVAAVVNRCEKS
jgi:hypothetical protein